MNFAIWHRPTIPLLSDPDVVSQGPACVHFGMISLPERRCQLKLNSKRRPSCAAEAGFNTSTPDGYVTCTISRNRLPECVQQLRRQGNFRSFDVQVD